jgi:hypothetical protein
MATPRRPLQEISSNSTIKKELSLYQRRILVRASRAGTKLSEISELLGLATREAIQQDGADELKIKAAFAQSHGVFCAEQGDAEVTFFHGSGAQADISLGCSKCSPAHGGPCHLLDEGDCGAPSCHCVYKDFVFR